MTLQEAFTNSLGQLEKIYDTSEATAMTEWLLEWLTGAKKSERLISLKKNLSSEQELLLQSSLSRLEQKEPLQYVINEAWFCGLRFYVDQHVLIPRPETEELVEWIISDCKFPINELSILDIGTGSGCIPIALKRRLGKATVYSSDVSADALKVAARNSKALGVDVAFIEADFLDTNQHSHLPKVDIIVSNPPYIPESDKRSMDKNVTDYEPQLALFVKNDDALIFYKRIAVFGLNHLNNGGNIYLELHEAASERVKELFEVNGYEVLIKEDMQGKRRMMRVRHTK